MFKHLQPLTPNAQQFFDKFGGIFFIKHIEIGEGLIRVYLNTCDDKIICVTKMSDGIHVDGQKFCEAW